MSNKKFNTRLQLKNDTEANWKKAGSSFIPLKGEMIIYSDLNKIKIGDGTTSVNELPFMNSESASKEPLILTATPTEEEGKYTTSSSVEEVLQELVGGRMIFMTFPDTVGSVVALSSAFSLDGETFLLYNATGDSVVIGMQHNNDFTMTTKRILSEEDVRTIILQSQLLKKKVITNYQYNTSGLWQITTGDGEWTEAEDDYIYFKKENKDGSSDIVYGQYMKIENDMVQIGTTKMDLENYVTKSEFQNALNNLPSSGEGGTNDYNQLINKPQTVALSTSISAASTDSNAVSPKAVYDYVQMAIASLPTVYTGDTTPDSTFGNNGDIFLIVEE